MRVQLPLFVGALLLASLAMAGAATAVPADGESLPTESVTDENESSDAGICLVGAGGPCNGDDQSERDKQPEHSEKQLPSDDGNESGDVGICMVGAGGPCNGDDQSERNDSQPAHSDEQIGSDDGNESSDVGICLTKIGGPCNGGDQLQYYGDDSTTDSVGGLSPLLIIDPFGFFEAFFDPLT